MPGTRQFKPEDIGAELLPIITKGIYRDPLDTLREYVQNSIDAAAHHVEISITSDLASVRDDGTGMSRQVAEKAIRLGMSEKDPTTDVGFRGIGVYSGFNICERLEIYTRSETGEASKLTFEFATARSRLQEEEKHRMRGGSSRLDLLTLLGDSVWVEDCKECPLAASGTLVMMVGIRGDVYNKLRDYHEVRRYLESVVPLPFHPDFRFKHKVESRFHQQDYRVVNLTLRIDGRAETVYRPYRNSLFTHGQGIGPEFYTLSHVLARGRLGFAWVCLNDARKYLPERAIRGLLIKKFGFSVGDRDQFARYFSRQVFNNRITGEIIITRDELTPNASRSEFEPSPLRDVLYLAFSDLATKISTWANKVQDRLKAMEELEEISPEVFNIVKKIPLSERDVPRLLWFNNLLASYENRLKTHKKTLEKLNPDLLERTLQAVKEAQQTITEVLRSREPAPLGRKRRVQRAQQAQAQAPRQEELRLAADRPQSLVDIIRFLEIEVGRDGELLLEYIDREVLRQRFSPGEYTHFVRDLLAFLEDNL